jgi:hypothetical protein
VSHWWRLAKEPPARILVRALLKLLPVSVETRALWELSPRPAYLVGVFHAALEAKREGVREISALEFGVAGGDGLLALESESAAVEGATGVAIRVYGFDRGAVGLPELIGDYRDHPDNWRAGDYPMDEARLQRRLSQRTTLVLGNVRETVPEFVAGGHAPIGFVAIDLDLYSSTRDALRVLSLPGARSLSHVPMYFDDIDFFFTHRFAGELLAIEEFNRENAHVKLDRWHGLRVERPFPERPFLDKMYVAHRLDAISAQRTVRAPAALSLRD